MGEKKIKINYKRLFLSIGIVLAIAILATISVKYVTSGNEKTLENANIAKEEEVAIPEDTTINLVAIGDIMCHDSNYKAAYNSDTKEYDFSPMFENVAKYISKADIAIGNLETTFAGEARGYSNYPTFNSPSALGTAIKNIGIDIVSTANNHSMDKGASGVISTLDTLDEIGLAHTGTYRSEEEQNTVLVKEVNGVKIAFLSFTYGTNGIAIPSGKEYLVNLIDKDLILKQINLAKEQNVDVICASMHWGVEYAQKQNSEQESLADYLFQNGVDIIIGNHAHVVEPMEKKTITLEDGTEKEVFVCYALGNFISGQKKEHTQSSIILDLKLTKHGDTGKITIDNVDYTPIYCYDSKTKLKARFRLLSVKEAMTDYENGDTSIVNASLYKTLQSELANTEKVVGTKMLDNVE